MGTVYFARWILLPDDSLLENGALLVSDGRIASIGSRSRVKRSRDDRIVNLGQALLLPGFINLHTHLEEYFLRGLLPNPGESYASFLSKKIHRLQSEPSHQIQNGVRLAIREHLSQGITTMVDFSLRDLSAEVLAHEPVRSWVIHVNPPFSPENNQTQYEHVLSRLKRSLPSVNNGIGSYHLYSAPPSLLNRIAQLSREQHCPWVAHVAETAEEMQAFSENSGDLFELITRTQPWQFGARTSGPVQVALRDNLIPYNGICLHANYLNGHELALLAARHISLGISVSYNTHFCNRMLPLDIARQRNLNLCAVTESVIESATMDILDELYQIKLQWPHIPSNELLSWITRNPAHALGAGDRIGSLHTGKEADIIAFRCPHSPGGNILDELIMEEPQLILSVVKGQEVIRM